MAVVLLALFPILLIYNPRAAYAAIGLAIVLLYRNRVKGARPSARHHVSDDSAI